MTTTADFVPIQDVRENLVLLKNGDIALILETSAVNFGLLSANEQLAIISSFAGLLNSLNFSIQIVIRSKRLDITDYLKVLDGAYQRQTNPLLANMMIRYRKFIETTVRENEVLDKQFFVVVSISYYEMGLTKAKEPDLKAAMTLLLPRRDHIIRQLSGIGLKANQLNTKQITQLFYDIYNFDPNAPIDNFSSTENAINLVKQASPEQAVSSEPVAVSQPSNMTDNQQNVVAKGPPAGGDEAIPVADNPQIAAVASLPRNDGKEAGLPTSQYEASSTSQTADGQQPSTLVSNLVQPPGRVNLPFVAEELKEEI